LRRDVWPLLSADDRAFAEPAYLGGEPVLFASVVLDAAADLRLDVDSRLLADVRRVVLPDAGGDDYDELSSALDRLEHRAGVLIAA